MFRKVRFIGLIIVVVAPVFFCHSACAEEYMQAQAAVGIKTTASGGRYTVSQVALIARQNGIDVMITADAFLNRWQYGLWPLRNVIRKTEQTRSVMTYGIRRYLDELKAVQERFPRLVIVGGLEAAPFYRWEGNPFYGKFALKDWHKHLLVVGLETVRDCKGLPVIGNGTALAKPAGFKSLLCLFFPILILSIGLFGMYEGRFARKDIYMRRHGILLMQWRYYGIALAIAGLLFLINRCPFRDLKYDQYHGDRGPMPYQNFIDHANRHNGMTFWAHPEAKNVEQRGKIDIETKEHTGLILETRDYTGFAVFYEGYDIIGRPGGLWDSVLREYCKGGRRSAAWAIGLLDYEQRGSLGEEMKNLRTVLLVKETNKDECLKALREGRAYVAKDANASRFRLDDFSVSDSAGTAKATMGQEVAITGSPRIRISGRFTGTAETALPVKILLIKDGSLIGIFEEQAPFDITYDDENAEEPGKHYYRVELRSSKLTLVTNPVFVTRKVR